MAQIEDRKTSTYCFVLIRNGPLGYGGNAEESNLFEGKTGFPVCHAETAVLDEATVANHPDGSIGDDMFTHEPGELFDHGKPFPE